MDPLSVLDSRPGVEIEIERRGRTTRYASRILGADSRVISLELPFEKGRPVRLVAGQSLNVYLKGRGKLWHFSTKVLGARVTPRPMLFVPRPAELIRVERRQYARADVRITPTYLMLLDRRRNRGYGLQATIRNVGGGGVMFVSPYLVDVGKTIKMAFELPDGYGEVKAIGVVIYNRLAREIGHATHAMGVAFTRISSANREAIIRFVLHRQSQMARARWEQT